MSSNYERLQNSSRRQLEAFIRSIVSKRASEFIDWHAWLSSDNPDVEFLGEDAVYKNDDGSERECRFMREETNEDGLPCRFVYFFEDDGDVSTLTVRADRVRKLTEEAYPVIEEPEDTPIDFFTAPVQMPKEAAAPVTESAPADEFDFDTYMNSVIETELNEAADQVQTAEDEITGRIVIQEQEAAAQALEDKPFTDIQNIDPDAADELPDIVWSEPEAPAPEIPAEMPEEPIVIPAEEPVIPEEVPAEELTRANEIPVEAPAIPEEIPAEEIPAEEPVLTNEIPAEEPAIPEELPDNSPTAEAKEYEPQLDEFYQALEDIDNTMQVEMKDVPLDEEDEPIGELLQTLKERSALYDPNNQEDHELPTIAFTAIAEDKLVNNE